MKKVFILATYLACSFCISSAQIQPMSNPVPSERQQKWNELEYYFFIHFGPNTFTDLEWGKGTEHEEVFDPSQLDCRQWCRIAKAAGAKGIIITAKHHDGFCLWPSKYSTHTVRESKWKNGKGDVLKELSLACKEYGLKFGVYLSPWDRNHPKYGTPEYNDVFVNMMKEILANYGPLFEFWWDGANGEGPNGKKQVYDWHRFEKTMRDLAPQTVVFSDIGPDIRWVGNENGIAGDPNWNLLDTAGFMRGLGAPPNDTLTHGNAYGKNWIPAECDVSIRPGWFYHQQEDEKVKTPATLFDLYLKSVGRGAHLLLNVPPDRRGLINKHDSTSLIGFRKLRDNNFRNNLAANARALKLLSGISQTSSQTSAATLIDHNKSTFESVESGTEKIVIRFKKPQKINCLILKENLLRGQNCMKFRLSLNNEKHESLKEIKGSTIGRKRIITFPSTNVSEISVMIEEQKESTAIAEIEVYHIDDQLVELLP